METRESTIDLPADHPIDIRIEEPHPLADIGKHLPGSPGYKLMHKLVRRGMRCAVDRDHRVKLKTIMIYGKMYSTVEAYHRMVAEANRR